MDERLRIFAHTLKDFLNGLSDMEAAVNKELARIENHSNQFVICTRVNDQRLEVCRHQPELKSLLLHQIKMKIEEATRRIYVIKELFVSQKCGKLLNDCQELLNTPMDSLPKLGKVILSTTMVTDWVCELEIIVVKFEEQLKKAIDVINASLASVERASKSEFKCLANKFTLRHDHSSKLQWMQHVLNQIFDEDEA